MNKSEQTNEIFKAISAAQGEFLTVEKSSTNPHFKSKFAPLDNIIEMLRPILPKHGLSFVQFTDITDGGIVVETVITHESGQWVSGSLKMPATKQDPQGYGSALTYGRRYGLSAAFGIASDEDVDGNNADEKPGSKTEQKQKNQQQQVELTPAQQAYGTIIDWIDKASAKLKTAEELKSWYLNDGNKQLVDKKSQLDAKLMSAANRHLEQTMKIMPSEKVEA